MQKFDRKLDKWEKALIGKERKKVSPVFIILSDKNNKCIPDWKLKLIRWAYIFRRSVFCQEYYPDLYIEPEDQSTAPVKIIGCDMNKGWDGDLSFHRIRKIMKEMEGKLNEEDSHKEI